uniref:DDE Tnp4 domain-containing protein n=1 Tax=Aegilops tauschii subsp. strangulata TaxID=200361 RepID=A0A453E6Z7_AEGTS
MAWAIPRPKKGSTIILEAVADQETWIWHAFFGMPGSLNDINVVNRSPLMSKIANGDLPPVQFVANGRTYNYGYYLADGIYPKCQTFVKLLKKPEDAWYI